ncbi:MAG: hypothetical protein HGA44_17335 [Cellulomonadaceae bacterium]|nr:hypothetical protein [Cellulomonadaceae bacterium]
MRRIPVGDDRNGPALIVSTRPLGVTVMDFRISVLLSLQRALWDLVTPNLRGVAVRVEYPEVGVRFLFDTEPSKDDRECVSEAETLVIADFLDDVIVATHAECVPPATARELKLGEDWVYLRKEST